MPPKRTWTAAPTRREFTLTLFALTVFVLSYNLEATLGLAGVRPQKLSSSYLLSIGLGTKDPGFDEDGRRPKQWRDKLEDMIVGDWEWREGEVSGEGRGHPTSSGKGRYAMLYDFGGKQHHGRARDLGDRGVSLSTGVTVQDQFVRWGNEVPQTKFVAHTPGFSILENVVAVNGTLFVVADDWAKVPQLGDIASSSSDASRPPQIRDWHMLTSRDANIWFGPYAAKIHGTSWMQLGSAESQDAYTLFSLFRTQASLASSGSVISHRSVHNKHGLPSSAAAHTSDVPAPLRLVFPRIPTFSTPSVLPPGDQDPKVHPLPRERAYTGVHPLLAKAVFPTVGMWFEEDWKDLADMHVPFLLERVVVADRGAAERGRDTWAAPRAFSEPISVSDEEKAGLAKRAEGGSIAGAPAWAAPLVALPAPQDWWAPARSALLRYLHVTDDDATSAGGFWGRQERKPVVTFVSMRDMPAGAGPRLSAGDEDKLVQGLRRMERDGALEAVHVVRGNGSVPALEWTERMGAFAKSSIVLGSYGPQLADSVFMRAPVAESVSSAASGKTADAAKVVPPLLMEFFPPGVFVREQQFAMETLGMDYIAWWNGRKFSSGDLPSVIPPTVAGDQHVPLDVDAVLQAVRKEAARRHS
ncbi:uncharacterized protein BXZ73DRAFT_74923 [Epithele typhae]|uniref:uncharacterized protein n=1 Tax=Epithele typhae TaxID=378194 RepID=UPI00200845F7|nr:uncharacterized protein BXZ73DRAFT_74923 [Epithele typhae]KAH9941738.1 hypothetical protein BXZ73DRAFT_74923 [Epithele typhae]